MERSTMIWYAPQDTAAHARQLKANGCEQVWIKAGVDNPGLRNVWSQWSGYQAQAYADAGVEPLAWFYVYPESPEVQYETIRRALISRPSARICLNAEVEWDDKDEAFVRSWIDGLRKRIGFADVHTGPIGFSSVPSWDKGVGGQGSPYHAFPYEAFCEACDFSMPQAYFLNPDQVIFENRRNTTGKPVIPTLWAVGDPSADPPGFSDEQLVEYARKVIGECEHFAGFSSWRGELATYQYDAMRRAYDLMPEVTAAVVPGSVTEVTSHPEGYLALGQPDVFDWQGEGVIVAREVTYYQPDTDTYYHRTWDNGQGYSDWWSDPKS